MSINYEHLSLAGVVTVILLVCHWIACLWGLTASFDPMNSWTGVKEYCVPWEADAQGMMPACPPGRTCFEAKRGMVAYSCASAFELYVYSLYWSIMTITSVGYGDISATPFNVHEQIVCSIIMLGTAMLWGFLIGVFCSLAASSPSVQAFRDELSQLNNFMADYNLPGELRFRLREFVHETVHLRNAEAQNALISKLSPAMQGEVSLMCNSRWVATVWYLRRGAQLELLIEIASRLKPQVFAPWEFVPSGAMYVVQRGCALWAARVRRAGSAFGEDILLNNRGLQLDFPALASTYLWVLCIDARGLHAAVKKFKASAPRLLNMARRWTIRRAIVRHAERECFSRGEMFRGRLYPIYAKEIAQKLTQRKLIQKPNDRQKNRRCSLLRALTRKGFDEESFNGRSNDTRTPGGSKKVWQKVALARRATKRAQESSSKSSGNVMKNMTMEMKAAANFGLQLREEQLQTNEDDSTDNKIQLLSDEVSELKRGMSEMISLLREQSSGRFQSLPPAT